MRVEEGLAGEKRGQVLGGKEGRGVSVRDLSEVTDLGQSAWSSCPDPTGMGTAT
jgi:hypothetical protein